MPVLKRNRRKLAGFGFPPVPSLIKHFLHLSWQYAFHIWHNGAPELEAHKMIAESQIREKLIKFLRNDISLDVFEDWLVQQSWNMHKDSDEAAQKLASAIELRLAEHSSGHLDDAALRDELRPFATNYTVAIWFGKPPLIEQQQEPPNNVTTTVKALQVVLPFRPAASPVATEYVDTTRAMARG